VNQIPKKVESQAILFVGLMSKYWSVDNHHLQPIYALNFPFAGGTPSSPSSNMAFRTFITDLIVKLKIEEPKMVLAKLFLIIKDSTHLKSILKGILSMPFDVLLQEIAPYFAGSGPFLVKLLQQVQNNSDSPSIRSVLGGITDHVPGMLPAEMESFDQSDHVTKLTGGLGAFLLKKQKTGGVASIG